MYSVARDDIYFWLSSVFDSVEGWEVFQDTNWLPVLNGVGGKDWNHSENGGGHASRPVLWFYMWWWRDL